MLVAIALQPLTPFICHLLVIGKYTVNHQYRVGYNTHRYTTLGTGDIEPHGDLRYLTGLESLTGLVLITWSASFLYLEMTRYWDEG